MSNTELTVSSALDQFIARFIAQYDQQEPAMPQQDFDPEWPSRCYQQLVAEGELCGWLPKRQEKVHELFDGLAHALEIDIHPDLKAYYSRYWSDPLPATCNEGDLQLLFVWNEDDYERLRANLIGHALMKKRRRQPLTLFFGCTEPEEMVISLDNATGEIVVESPGKKPHQTLANSMAEFILQLSPRMIP